MNACLPYNLNVLLLSAMLFGAVGFEDNGEEEA
jgi:hypothetical protein